MSRIKRILSIAGILILSLGISAVLIFTGPRIKKRKPDNSTPETPVRIMEMKSSVSRVIIEAMGKVSASKTVTVGPRVSGKIIWRNRDLVPGGVIKKGRQLVKIDPGDYELAVQAKEADLSDAVLNLKLEEGRQVVAKKEYEMMGKDLSDEEKKLVLRKYYFDSAQKGVDSAQASLKRAETDLARTALKAPFNAVVIETFSDIGSIVSSGSQIAKIAGSDNYWVILSVPVEKLKWIEVSGKNSKGSEVKLFSENVWGKGVFRTGEVIKIGADLQDNGYMAKVIVEIDDPLSLKKENRDLPALILGMYLNAEITGKSVENSIKIPRIALREKDSIYFTDQKMILNIEHPEILFKGRKEIVIRGDKYRGKYLILSSISSPAEGIPLKILSDIKKPVKKPDVKPDLSGKIGARNEKR